MAGNSSRKGAVRQSKKGPSSGSGGNNKRRLEGKGPTPKAEDRPYHAAAKRKKAAEKRNHVLHECQKVIVHVVKLFQDATLF
jgi:23S rRNA (guanosine2251-2'-O)-methyltransferase